MTGIQEFIKKGGINDQRFKLLYDKHINKGTGEMKKRVERFKAALRKITWDTKLITFNI